MTVNKADIRLAEYICVTNTLSVTSLNLDVPADVFGVKGQALIYISLSCVFPFIIMDTSTFRIFATGTAHS